MAQFRTISRNKEGKMRNFNIFLKENRMVNFFQTFTIDASFQYLTLRFFSSRQNFFGYLVYSLNSCNAEDTKKKTQRNLKSHIKTHNTYFDRLTPDHDSLGLPPEVAPADLLSSFGLSMEVSTGWLMILFLCSTLGAVISWPTL